MKDFLRRKQDYYIYKTHLSLNQPVLYDAKHKRQETVGQSFAEQCCVYRLREFKSNTRMNVKAAQYHSSDNLARRDRMISYWKQNIVPNHLPPISA